MEERGYDIINHNKKIEIVPRSGDRPSVNIVLNEYGFWNIENNIDIPLYCFKYLLHYSINKLYESWSSPRFPKFVPKLVMNRMQDWTRKSLCKDFQQKWQNQIDRLNPTVSSLHKKFFSTGGGHGNWGNVKEILQENNSYIIEDALNYRAARISILYDNHKYWLRDWTLSFAYSNNEKYRSLMRTLMNLPNGIIVSDSLNFSGIILPEPVLTRFKFFAYSTIAADASWKRVINQLDEERLNWELEVIKKSSEEDIKNAIKYMWYYFPNGYNNDFRKLVQIKLSLKMIFDYLGILGNWDIIGLARRSEIYHHNTEMMRRAERERLTSLYEKREEELQQIKKSKTFLPPIPLPENKNIKFLNSYKEVEKEGSIMNHCIAQYAEKAVGGKCYLFHIDYQNQMASVEVSPNGFVVQSYGPKDTTNNASKYGKDILGKWAKQLRTVAI